MTGLDKIVGEIEQESKDGVNAILDEARKKADKITGEAEKEIHAAEKEIADRAAATAAQALKQADEAGDIIKRRCLLAAKQEIIEETLLAAKKKLYELSDSDYAAFLEKLIIENADQGRGVITFGKEDAGRLPEGFVDQVSAKLTDGRSVAEGNSVADFAHGFILSYEGSYENVSIDELFLAKKDELTDIIKETIFD